MMRLIATFGGVGDMRPAPGTWGSLAALPVAWLLMILVGPFGLIVATALIYVIGIKATEAVVKETGDHDPSQVVIDEVAGQWIALWPIALGAWWTGSDYMALWPGWIAAFVLFRLFDITKWGPVGTADRRGDATGVMLDDVIAGAFAAIGVIVLAVVGHGLGRVL